MKTPKVPLGVAISMNSDPHCFQSETLSVNTRREGHEGPVSERRLSENSEYVNPEMRETLGFPFQNGRFVKLEKAG